MGKSVGARKGWVRLAVGLMMLALAVVASGCGSSSSSSSSSAETSSTESSGTESSSTETSGGDFAAAEKFVAEHEKEPSSIHAQHALAAKPKPGKIIYLQCAVAQCAQQAAGMKEAAEASGWSFEVENYDSADPSTLITGLQNALTKDPNAVVFTGSPEEIWAPEIPAYEKAGVAMIPMFVGPAKIEGPVIANISPELENEIAGKLLADWFMVDSGGTGTALIQAVPGYPAITLWVENFEKEVAAECPGCSVEVVEASLEELGNGSSTQTMVSALQRNADAKYAFSYNGNFLTGLPGEAQNAGLSEVKVGTYSTTGDYVAEAAAGKDFGLIMLSNIYAGWAAMNAALQHEEGYTLSQEEELLTTQLATEKSATQELAERANSYTAPPSFKQEFKKLWGVG